MAGKPRKRWLPGLSLGVAGCAAAPSPEGPPAFEDLTAALGLPATARACLAWRDFDGDGRADLLAGTAAPGGGAELSLWKAAGTGFVEAPIATGGCDVTACAAGDLDRDGVLEVVATCHDGRVLAFRRRGAEYEPRTIAENRGLLEVAAVGDVDGDGRADVVAGGHGNVAPGAACVTVAGRIHCELAGGEPPHPVLLRQQEGGVFAPEQLPDPVQANGFNLVPWSGDGTLAVYVSVDHGADRLYRRSADGTWTDLLPGLGASVPGTGMGVAFGDFLGDGRFWLYGTATGPDFLWKFDGERLTEVTDEAGVRAATALRAGWDPVVEDFDDDGRDDLFVETSLAASSTDEMLLVARRKIAARVLRKDVLFLNAGSGTFRSVSVPHRDAGGGLGTAFVATGDVDGDGRRDVAVLDLNESGELRVLRNVVAPAANHWLEVEVRDGPALATGAEVSVFAGGHRIAHRWIDAGRLGGPSDEVHVGLGSATTAEAVEVRFQDGQVVRLDGPLAAGRRHVVRR